jgi:nitroimidazol reductase NimA-like FMN-containing flavoprotein (pyridoxamine 5'-phosphate oxidase superfamily)
METRTSTEFNAEVERYLRNNHAVTLSTSSLTGLPHANTAAYVSDDQRLYFFVRDGSILLSNLAGSHHVAFTIDEYAPPWQKRRELHGSGDCGVADDQQSKMALELCAEKFEDFTPTGALWWLEPSGMYFIDYIF